eukprot:scaffold9746_cov21-Prasinocladus_malaysianus.AAC.1
MRMQVMWSLPGLPSRYLTRGQAIMEDAPPDSASDLITQLAKLGRALVEGKVGAHQPDPAPPGGEAPPEPKPSVAPRRFKTLAGRGHPEFSSGRQQVWSSGPADHSYGRSELNHWHDRSCWSQIA